MKARKPLPRRQAPIKRSAIRKRGPSKSEDLRKRGSLSFRAFLKLTPCLWCGVTRVIEQAHFGKHGMGKKNDWTQTGPLCGPFTVWDYSYPGCHSRWDRREMPEGVEWFTAAERHTILLRQAAFLGDWQRQLEHFSHGVEA